MQNAAKAQKALLEATFELATPPSVNAMYANRRGGGRGRVPTRAYESWQRGELKALIAQRAKPVLPPVNVSISLPSTMRGDADNRCKPTLDLLVKAGVIPNDNRNIVRSITIDFHDAPMMKVCVKSLEEAT